MELCPLPEEFEDLLGYNLDFTSPLAISNLGISDPYSIQYQMAQMFNLPPQSSARLILSSEIELESFLKILPGINTEEAHWSQMMALYLYAQFLLVSLSENCDSKILHILS